MTATLATGTHPNFSSSTLSQTKYINRYWTLTNSGVAFTTYSATFTYVVGDVQGSANTNNLIIGRYASAAWTYPSVSNSGVTTTGTGLTAFGDFVLAETGVIAPIITSILTGSNIYGTAGSYTITASNTPTSYGLTGQPTGVTISGAVVTIAATTAAGSYNLSISATNAAGTDTKTLVYTVNTKALTITGVTANNKVYNATTTATLSGTAAYSGLANGETPSVSGTPTATFASANVGTSIAVTISGYTVPSANYTLTQPTGLTANITAAPLSITVAANNKTYDGTTTATLGTATLSGVIAADVSNVTLSGSGVTAAFANATVGTGKPVTLTGNYTISGSASGNYSLTQPSGLTANITQAVLTVTAANASRIYGAANPTFTVSYSGFVGSESAANLTTAPTATTTATNTPMFTPLCSTAASQGRHVLGQVSEMSDAPTAHSPPMPSAARKRKISRCHHSVEKYDSPVKQA